VTGGFLWTSNDWWIDDPPEENLVAALIALLPGYELRRGPYLKSRRAGLLVNLAIYCADIGSIQQGRFGWARTDTVSEALEHHRGGIEIVDLVDAIAEDLTQDYRVALGFECPLFVPVPEDSQRLGRAWPGEGNRSWSAGAGAGAMATGIVEVAWLLSELRRRRPQVAPTFDWDNFMAAEDSIFLWEAFISGAAKAMTHIDDATVAVNAFRDALPDPTRANAVTADKPLSLLGAAVVWSGWTKDASFLRKACLVIKA
jgi:hypothetical protein